ncbi:MAG: hypothetical protein WDN04_14605 [Rhodospirillales bacterium]
MSPALNALEGKPETDLVRAMGVPTRTYDTGGHRFLAYSRSKLETIPGDPDSAPGGAAVAGAAAGGGWGGWGYGLELIQRDCETTFDLLKGTVQSWSLRGNDC